MNQRTLRIDSEILAMLKVANPLEVTRTSDGNLQRRNDSTVFEIAPRNKDSYR
jgi:hypothetical protein